MVKCESCGTEKMTDKVVDYSKQKFKGKILCFNCQKKEDVPEEKENADALDKTSYWQNKEKRDIITQERIARHGAINTAIEAIKLSMSLKEEKIGITAEGIIDMAIILADKNIIPYTIENKK